MSTTTTSTVSMESTPTDDVVPTTTTTTTVSMESTDAVVPTVPTTTNTRKRTRGEHTDEPPAKRSRGDTNQVVVTYCGVLNPERYNELCVLLNYIVASLCTNLFPYSPTLFPNADCVRCTIQRVPPHTVVDGVMMSYHIGRDQYVHMQTHIVEMLCELIPYPPNNEIRTLVDTLQRVQCILFSSIKYLL